MEDLASSPEKLASLVSQLIPAADAFIGNIVMLKGPKLLVAFTVLLGYLLKSNSKVPNQLIPRILFAVCTPLAPFIVAWPEPGQMDPNLKFPEVAAWLQSLICGALLVAFAWLFHARLLKPLIDKQLRSNPEPVPAQPNPTIQ